MTTQFAHTITPYAKKLFYLHEFKQFVRFFQSSHNWWVSVVVTFRCLTLLFNSFFISSTSRSCLFVISWKFEVLQLWRLDSLNCFCFHILTFSYCKLPRSFFFLFFYENVSLILSFLKCGTLRIVFLTFKYCLKNHLSKCSTF